MARVDHTHRRTIVPELLRSWRLGQSWAVMRLSRSICLLLSLALAATLVGQVIAAPLKRRTQHGGSDYHEQLLDKVPFGSQEWWHIYQRQRPGGG
jgi:hypothetical protein